MSWIHEHDFTAAVMWWMAELGAFAIRSDTELLLKSRRVIPGRLLAAGFEFGYGQWAHAARDLVRRARTR